MGNPVFRKPDGTVFVNKPGNVGDFCSGIHCFDCGCESDKVGMYCQDFISKYPERAAKAMGYEFIGIQDAEGEVLTPAHEPLGPTGFVRDAHAGKGRMDLLPWIGIMEVSKLCEEGALHYGERNIDKGAPLHSLLDSGARHLAKVMSGYTDEDHLRAACWNLLWALQERTTHPELNDTPWPWYEKEDGQE